MTRGGRRPDPIPIAFLAALFLISLVPLLAFLPDDADVVLPAGRPGGLAAAVAEAHPDLRVAERGASDRLTALTGAEPFTAVDATVAERYGELGRDGAFTPLTRSTIVIARDPTRVTADEVRQLSDLGRLGHGVFVSGGETLPRAVAAIAASLGGDDPEPASRDAALALLRGLRQGPGLEVGAGWREWPDLFGAVPVAVLSDDEAAALRREGLPIEVSVPADGTLTWVDGLWSGDPVAAAPGVAPDVLAAHGLRAADGTADPSLYPPAADYGGARELGTVADREWLDRLYDGLRGDVLRDVLGTGYHAPATGKERLAVYAAFSGVVLAWGASLVWRARSRWQGRLLQAMSFALVALLLMRVLASAAVPPADRLLSYSFQPAMLAILAIFALLAHDISRRRGTWRHTGRVAAWGSGALAVMVLTNDLHHSVHHLCPPGGPGDTCAPGTPGLPWLAGTTGTPGLAGFPAIAGPGPTYGPGDYLLAVWIVWWSGYTMVSLLRSAGRVRDYRALAAIAVLIVGLFGYHVAFNLGAPLIRETELPLVTALCIIALVEAMIRSGLIPANRRYLELFQSMSVPAALLDDGYRVMDRSEAATLPPEEVRARLASGDTTVAHRPGGGVAVDYHRLPVDGGHVVWETDMSALIRARTNLADTRASLDRRLTLLRRAATADGDRRKLEYGNAVLRMLQRTIDERLELVTAVGKRLSDGETGPAVTADLRRVRLALTYCKRAGLAILEDHEGYRAPTRERLAEDLRALCASFTAGPDSAAAIVRGAGEPSITAYMTAFSIVHRLLDDAAAELGATRAGGEGGDNGPGALDGLITVTVSPDDVRITALWEPLEGPAPDGDALLRGTRGLPDRPASSESVDLLRASAEPDGAGVRLTVDMGVRQ